MDKTRETQRKRTKRIVFFDGDGTLWYPKKTGYEEKPWWIYEHPKTKKNPNEHSALMPGVRATLKELKARGVILALISGVPYKKERAVAVLRGKLEHFGLTDVFDEVMPSYKPNSRRRQNRKDKSILAILKKKRLPKNSALMVGDSYEFVPCSKKMRNRLPADTRL